MRLPANPGMSSAPSGLRHLAVLVLPSLLGGTSIDYRATYPESCPLGVDWTGQKSRLCLPKWTATYNMSLSTIIMPCNTSGYYDAAVAAQFGIVDIDWSNGKQLWANAQPMDCEDRLVQQARMIKERNGATKVWVYRNLVKALPWYASVREKLCDPAYEGWFLKFDPNVAKPHVPKCDDNWDPPKCSEFYHDQEQTPQHPSGDGSCREPCDCGCVPCGEYLWDHRNQSLREWLVDEHLTGPTSLGSGVVDGIFTDDEWRQSVNDPGPAGGIGPSEEDRYSMIDMGLSRQDAADLAGNWTLSMRAVHQAVLDKGGFAWRLFSPGSSTGGGDPVGGRAGCAASLRARCVRNDTLQHSALMMGTRQAGDFEQDLAAFLLIRGPYAWFGHPWEGCNVVPSRPPALDVDYGEPLSHCTETTPGSGVFVREWTKAIVRLDCNAWAGSITPKSTVLV